jgi:hypothetical protein
MHFRAHMRFGVESLHLYTFTHTYMYSHTYILACCRNGPFAVSQARMSDPVLRIGPVVRDYRESASMYVPYLDFFLAFVHVSAAILVRGLLHIHSIFLLLIYDVHCSCKRNVLVMCTFLLLAMCFIPSFITHTHTRLLSFLAKIRCFLLLLLLLLLFYFFYSDSVVNNVTHPQACVG